jgi:hypothetical protein
LLTFFQENSLQERVLVTEHQTLIRRAAVTLLKRLERLLIVFDGSLELLDIFRPPFTKRGLRLSISLLSFFRRRIYRLSSSFTFLSLSGILDDNFSIGLRRGSR